MSDHYLDGYSRGSSGESLDRSRLLESYPGRIEFVRGWSDGRIEWSKRQREHWKLASTPSANEMVNQIEQACDQIEQACEWIIRARKELQAAASTHSRDEWLETPIDFLDRALDALQAKEREEL